MNKNRKIAIVVTSVIIALFFTIIYAINMDEESSIKKILESKEIPKQKETVPPEMTSDSKYSGLTEEQIVEIRHIELGCKKTGNQTACDETIREKINYYRKLNQDQAP